MTIKKGTILVPLRIATGRSMDGFTSLVMIITKPDGTKLTKTSASGEVDAPAVALVDDPDLGDVDASTYLEYINTVDDYDQVGDVDDVNPWKVCGESVVAGQTLPVSPVPFTVEEGCE